MTKFACFLFILLSCTRFGHTQNIYGSSSINFNATGTTGTADCETDLDGEADDGFYAARVTCAVRDPNGKALASGAYSDDGDRNGFAAVTLTFSTTPGVTYTVTGIHSAAVTVPYDAPIGQPPSYFDELNFEAYIETPDRDLANSYQWFGPGPAVETQRKTLIFPPTTAKGTAPETATVNVYSSDIAQDAINIGLVGTSSGILTVQLVGTSSSPTIYTGVQSAGRKITHSTFLLSRFKNTPVF